MPYTVNLWLLTFYKPYLLVIYFFTLDVTELNDILFNLLEKKKSKISIYFI